MSFDRTRSSSKARSVEEGSDEEYEDQHRKRRMTVYDIVAGRVNRQRFITNSYSSRWRRNVSSSRTIRPSNDILSHSELDENLEEWINEDSLDDVPLPTSDILEGIQSYSGHLYANAIDGRRAECFFSMNGTALIAMGVLLEEMSNEILGEAGDLVLAEHEHYNDDGDIDDTMGPYVSDVSVGSGMQTVRSGRKRSASATSKVSSKNVSETEEEREKEPRNKKMRRDK